MKTFLLCVGAQKAGTTWLYEYLSSHPDADLGEGKEYHFLDHLIIKANGVADSPSWLESSLKTCHLKLSKQTRFEELKYQFRIKPEKYFEYFKRKSANQDILLVGDMTPAYAMLSEKSYFYFKNKIDEYGLKLKIIFIMRDPVERIISAVRMNRKKNKFLCIYPQSEREQILRNYKKRAYELRTRYELTMKHLEKIFDQSDILYTFYEDLFTEQTVSAITDFLGLSRFPADFSKEINVSRTKNEIFDEDRKKIYNYYESTFTYIAERFGDERVKAIWPNYRRFGEKLKR